MKSSFYSRSSTMAMAAVLALALLGTPTSACEDDPTYLFKNKAGRDCDWIGDRNSVRKNKLCDKKSVKKNCPVTCDACDDLLKSKCPKTQKKMNKLFNKEECDDYVSGLSCPYNHVYTGCSSGNIICTPQQIYTCFDNDPPTGKTWGLATVRLEFCPDPPYGESCDPDECPPIEPQQGASCGWYDGKDTCGYNPIWFGCGFDDLVCNYLFEYTCDPVTLTWDKYVRPQKRCATPPGSPKGLPCEIGDEPPSPPPPLPEPCDVEPEPKTNCKSGFDETCLGGYSVQGCSPNTLSCSAGVAYDCSEEGVWEQRFIPQILCVSQDPRWGTSCDPDVPIPPLPPPPPTGPCDPEPTIPSGCEPGFDETCFGGYSIQGCSPDTLSCSPGVIFDCVPDGFSIGSWRQESLPQISCITDDPRIGTACDPDEPIPPPPPPPPALPCAFEPEPGQSCKPGYDGTCLGGYSVRGCTPDTFYCSPGVAYDCTLKGVWEQTFLPQILCISEDPLWGTSCDPLS